MKYLVYILTFIISFLLWLGSMILSFFGGMIALSIINDREKKRPYRPYPSGAVNYSGLRMDATSGHLRRPYNEETSKNWSDDPRVNQLVLRNAEEHINNTLRRRGHVFLNDVYDLLGMTRTSHGAISGWLFTDNKLIAFTPNDLEPGDEIELEFDYDGVIYNRLVILEAT